MSGGTDQAALAGQLLESLGIDSPELRQALAASFAQPAQQAGAPSRRERQLAAALRRSEKVNAALVAKIEMLACALGACPSCWGNDPDCGDCGGEGQPGRMDPDRRCFMRFVAPVLERLEAVPGPSGPAAPMRTVRPLKPSDHISEKENGS